MIPLHEREPDLRRIPLLSPEECRAYADRVIALRRYWQKHGEHIYTLGASAYLDHPTEYSDKARNLNTRLNAVFPELYKELYMFLGGDRRYNLNAFDPTLAYPGFHIFTSESNYKHGSVHIDLPWLRQNLSFHRGGHFSFTLCLSKPLSGAGMWVWEGLSTEQWAELSRAEANTLDKFPEHRKYLDYQEGVLYIHNGLCPHQICNPGDMADDEYRITLQGHGFRTVEGRTALYF